MKASLREYILTFQFCFHKKCRMHKFIQLPLFIIFEVHHAQTCITTKLYLPLVIRYFRYTHACAELKIKIKNENWATDTNLYIPTNFNNAQRLVQSHIRTTSTARFQIYELDVNDRNANLSQA